MTVAALMLAGCEGTLGDKERLGLIGGAIGGLVVGAGVGGVAVIAIGAATGAFAGDRVGHTLDDRDRARARAAEEQSVILGKPTVWRSPETATGGRVDPSGEYVDGRGRTCRAFSHIVTIEGEETTANGVGCQNPDGTWTLQGRP